MYRSLLPKSPIKETIFCKTTQIPSDAERDDILQNYTYTVRRYRSLLPKSPIKETIFCKTTQIPSVRYL